MPRPSRLHTAATQPHRSTIHTLAIADVCQALQTSPGGLSREEAENRLNRFGANTIGEVKGKPLYLKFLANFTHMMAILLWVGGLVGFLARMPQLGIAIWMVNLINGVFSFWQEYRADKATEALRRLLPSYARVLRDGTELQIPAEELVPGDVMLLAEGEHISADGRLIREAELRTDQSTLSGESHPARKTAEAVLASVLGRTELPNLVFAGTSVASGTGIAVVFATGMDSEFGNIAHLTQSIADELSPLQKEMGRVTRIVTALATGIGLLFFVLATFVAGVTVAESFIFAMGMIVAFVPEGMLPTVTLSLAMGVQRMAGRNALVKRLSAVETLGCTTVICTDKTGTLTENEMTVRGIWLDGRSLTVTGGGYDPEGEIRDGERIVPNEQEGDLRRLLLAAGLCNDARLLPPDDDHPRWTVLGDPTEAALRLAAVKGGVDLELEAQRRPRLRELPFDSRRKMMSTVHRGLGTGDRGAGTATSSSTGEDNSLEPLTSNLEPGLLTFVKGAPREVVALCSQILQDGREQPLDQLRRDGIMLANDSYARSGLRVLAVAQRRLPAGFTDFSSEGVERDLTFLGLMAMMDPPRSEVSAAVEKCHRAGIRVMMITGDYGLTAESIARRIGIIGADRPQLISGADLDSMDADALKTALAREVIFARAAPEHKLRIVSALREMGQVVAVTGDGVNDAPALKQADIGVAMGISGTDVAKEAADMILTDDNFASIVNAVEEGRAVYANIRKFAVYVFNSNMAEAVPFIVMLFSRGLIPLPLTIMQVLSIDLGTDMLPAIGLGSEPPESGVMDQPPRSQQEALLNTRLLALALCWYGTIEATAAMSGYFFLNWLHGWPAVPLAGEGTEVYRMATTMALACIVISQAGAVLACRSRRASTFSLGIFGNRLVLLGIATELVILAILIYVPFLQSIFHTEPIGIREWLFAAAWAPLLFFSDELRKKLLRWRECRKGLPVADQPGGNP